MIATAENHFSIVVNLQKINTIFEGLKNKHKVIGRN